MPHPSVDVIVCAHNEEATICDVLDAVQAAPSRGRVIVVADACTDSTTELVAARQHEDAELLLSIVANHTKGSSMADGLRLATSQTVAFVDADLSGLTTMCVETLLTHPPRPGMVVGLRDGWPVPLGRFPSLSGERRLPRRLAEEVGLAGVGWEAELRINGAVVAAGLPWAHVHMTGVFNPRRNKPEEWAKVTGATVKHGSRLAKMLLRTRKVRP